LTIFFLNTNINLNKWTGRKWTRIQGLMSVRLPLVYCISIFRPFSLWIC